MEYTEQENEKMQKMLLSPHFALGEFTKSGTAIKHGVDKPAVTGATCSICKWEEL